MGEWINGYIARMEALDQEAFDGGGSERIEVQHQLGKTHGEGKN